MSAIGDALDVLAQAIATGTGLNVTRDPGKVLGGCVYIGQPAVTDRTLGAFRLEVPVHLVGKGPGDSIARDWLAEQVFDFMIAAHLRDVNPGQVEPTNGQQFPAFTGTTTITVRNAS